MQVELQKSTYFLFIYVFQFFHLNIYRLFLKRTNTLSAPRQTRWMNFICNYLLIQFVFNLYILFIIIVYVYSVNKYHYNNTSVLMRSFMGNFLVRKKTPTCDSFIFTLVSIHSYESSKRICSRGGIDNDK